MELYILLKLLQNLKRKEQQIMILRFMLVCPSLRYHRKILTRGQLYDIYGLFNPADNYDSNGVYEMLDTNIQMVLSGNF